MVSIEAIECEDDPLGNGSFVWTYGQTETIQSPKIIQRFLIVQIVHFCYGTICETYVKTKCLTTSSMHKIQVTNTLTQFI